MDECITSAINGALLFVTNVIEVLSHENVQRNAGIPSEYQKMDYASSKDQIRKWCGKRMLVDVKVGKRLYRFLKSTLENNMNVFQYMIDLF